MKQIWAVLYLRKIMKTKLYYLTRSYYPYQKGGGPLMRKGAVEYLQKFGWDVIVVMPNYESKKFKNEDNILQIPFKNKHIQKLAIIYERCGIYEDYLDKWVQNAFEYLKDKITQDDILFATSGGELGMIKLGSLIKNEKECYFVVNFRDPLDYSYVHGIRRDKKFHINRELKEEKYLGNSDLIITSSKSNLKSLTDKYPKFKRKILCNYFGYINKIPILHLKQRSKNKLRIAYIGNMNKIQSPEILYNAYLKMENRNRIELYFIGDYSSYKPISSINDENVHRIPYLSHDDLLQYMCKNIDIGFVSLNSDYLGACVPSKIYEYINLGLPIIGALPNGDGKDIINNYKYGRAHHFTEVNKLTDTLEQFLRNSDFDLYRNNVLRDRKKWGMNVLIKQVDYRLNILAKKRL